MSEHKHVRISSFFLPVLVVGMLQLSGCSDSAVAPVPAGGVYVSTSAGATFDQSVAITNSAENIATYSLKGVFRSPKNPAHIYMAAAERGMVTSTDNGQTWTVVSTPLSNTADVVVLDNGIIVVAGIDADGQGFILRSLDEGKGWQNVLTIPIPTDTRSFQLIGNGTAVPSIVLSLELDPFNPNKVYAGNNLGTVFAGEQSAKVWRTLYTLTPPKFDPTQNQERLGIQKIIPSPYVQGELLIITIRNELIRVNPVNQTTITIPEYIDTPAPFGGSAGSRSVHDVSFIPNFPNALLVGVKDGAVVTRDQGATWVELKVPVDATIKFNSVVVAVSPTNSNRLSVAINDVIYRSEDGGVSWNTYSLGLTNHWISSISIDPSNAARVLLTVTPAKT